MFFNKNWKYKVTGVDGDCTLYGVNIFKYNWTFTGEKITIVDPKYNQPHLLNVFTVEIRGKLRKFAACEFSNNIWGFYVLK